ncbi:unnamed protein product [Amoebophrya sp. A25]|nr:unnamed protein product [Amoebophrya sp. A25]|eukprot:GSA25T00008699001.1
MGGAATTSSTGSNSMMTPNLMKTPMSPTPGSTTTTNLADDSRETPLTTSASPGTTSSVATKLPSSNSNAEVVEFLAPGGSPPPPPPHPVTTNSTSRTSRAQAQVEVFHLADASDDDGAGSSSNSATELDPFHLFDKKSYDIRKATDSSGIEEPGVEPQQQDAQTTTAQQGRGTSASSSSFAGGHPQPGGSPTTSNPLFPTGVGGASSASSGNRARTRSDQVKEMAVGLLHGTEDLDDLLPRVQQQPFLHYVCVAMMIRIREVLLAGDFIENMKILQSYPPFFVHETLHLAVTLMRQHEIRLRGFAAGKMILSAAGNAIADAAQGAIESVENLGSGAIHAVGHLGSATVSTVSSVAANEKVQKAGAKLVEKADNLFGWLGTKLTARSSGGGNNGSST